MLSCVWNQEVCEDVMFANQHHKSSYRRSAAGGVVRAVVAVWDPPSSEVLSLVLIQWEVYNRKVTDLISDINNISVNSCAAVTVSLSKMPLCLLITPPCVSVDLSQLNVNVTQRKGDQPGQSEAGARQWWDLTDCDGDGIALTWKLM